MKEYQSELRHNEHGSQRGWHQLARKKYYFTRLIYIVGKPNLKQEPSPKIPVQT
jgi:hypothetical protein